MVWSQIEPSLVALVNIGLDNKKTLHLAVLSAACKEPRACCT